MEANVTAFVLNLLFVAICGAQESERCSAAQDNPMLNFQQEPPQEPQCTVRPKTYEKAYPEQDNVQKKSVPVVDNYPHDGARRRQHSNCESQNWNPEAAKHAGHAAFRYKATRGSQKQPLDTVEQVPACKTSQEPTGSPQDGFHVTLLVQARVSGHSSRYVAGQPSWKFGMYPARPIRLQLSQRSESPVQCSPSNAPPDYQDHKREEWRRRRDDEGGKDEGTAGNIVLK